MGLPVSGQFKMPYLTPFSQFGERLSLEADLNPPGIADSDQEGIPGRAFDGLPLFQHQFFRPAAVRGYPEPGSFRGRYMQSLRRRRDFRCRARGV